ncbi:GNAT family N-acetyltransferase [Rhodococcus sp. 077-4]|uniref:GNAT family N-acetyltransferase n=1 Tax=Rhodococcus sp. 077-4 TaxID=2789271 RepID=UPI0039F48108
MFDVRPARIDDAEAILALRHAAEDWLAERGIDQWPPREVPLTTIRNQVAAGEFVVMRPCPELPIVAAMRLIWSDESIWQHDNVAAGYVHNLVIDRAYAGRGLGRALLDWADHAVRDAGATLLRLDCAESNTELRAYYCRCGFREVGRREFRDSQWFSVTLFQRDVPR